MLFFKAIAHTLKQTKSTQSKQKTKPKKLTSKNKKNNHQHSNPTTKAVTIKHNQKIKWQTVNKNPNNMRQTEKLKQATKK